MRVFRLWEEARVPRDNMQIPVEASGFEPRILKQQCQLIHNVLFTVSYTIASVFIFKEKKQNETGKNKNMQV